MKKKIIWSKNCYNYKTDFLCVRSLSFEIIEVDGNDEAGNGLDKSDNNFIVCISPLFPLSLTSSLYSRHLVRMESMMCTPDKSRIQISLQKRGENCPLL